MELYHKYRPKKPSELLGQDTAVQTLRNFVTNRAMPHAMIFSGPSGVGKTTMARIIRRVLKCEDADWEEINASKARGIDEIRAIGDRMQIPPFGTNNTRIWCIDEAHGLTTIAQESFLKILEDQPKHAYFILCTTIPGKLKATIRSRCTEIKFTKIDDKEIAALVKDIASKEMIPLNNEVLAKIVEMSEGGARKALVFLNAIMYEGDTKKQLALLEEPDAETYSINLCRALQNSKTTWPQMAKLLTKPADEPETIRRSILGYAKSVLLKKPKDERTAAIIDRFQDHFFDSGHAGLVLACYDLLRK